MSYYLFTDEKGEVIEKKTSAELAIIYKSHLGEMYGKVIVAWTQVGDPSAFIEVDEPKDL